MNFSIKYIVLVALLMVFSLTSNAQKNLFTEGVITYQLSAEGMSELSEILDETTLTLYIKDNQYKIDLEIMGGFAQLQMLSTNKLNTFLLDFPMLSDKVAIPMQGEDDLLSMLMVANTVNSAPQKQASIQYFYKDKRKLLKQKCYRAELPMKGSSSPMIMYLSKKIGVSKKHALFNALKVDALPLSFDFKIDDVLVSLVAVDIEAINIDDEVFDVPADYFKRSIKELKKEFDEILNGGDVQSVGL